jgi:hypothetical protein
MRFSVNCHKCELVKSQAQIMLLKSIFRISIIRTGAGAVRLIFHQIDAVPVPVPDQTHLLICRLNPSMPHRSKSSVTKTYNAQQLHFTYFLTNVIKTLVSSHTNSNACDNRIAIKCLRCKYTSA